MYETINSPINYGGLELKNRIIFAPTTFGLSDDAYFEKIRKIAAGGCAMIIIGDVPVGKSQFEKCSPAKEAVLLFHIFKVFCLLRYHLRHTVGIQFYLL